ncbi:MAG: metallophosphoesterase [Bdellovibrionota bacterium]
MHTNDTHGHAWSHKDRDGVVRGGFAAQNQVVDDVWREVDSAGGFTFVLSAGDVNTGVPESDLLDGEPDIMAMNRIGYDAMVLGNHEFDKGVEKITKQQGWAKFPLHQRQRADQRRELPHPSLCDCRSWCKSRILGLTTGSEGFGHPELIKDLVVEDPITAAETHPSDEGGRRADHRRPHAHWPYR